MSERFTIAIPMAGFGSRLRPHTWSKPKSLIGLAGRTVLDFCLAQFNSLPGVENANWVFIVGPGQQALVEAHLKQHHPKKSVHFFTQEMMRGQADALYLARQYFNGPMLMIFSDTLIETDLCAIHDTDLDGIAWVKQVPDPRRFGSALLDKKGFITKLIEKPDDINLNLVVVGFYYFKSGTRLVQTIEEQMAKGITKKGEYYLTDTINLMIDSGARFRTQNTEIWLDAGTRDAVLETNKYLLDHGQDNSADYAAPPSVSIIPPVYIPADVELEECQIGPHVALGAGAKIYQSVVSDSIVEDGTSLTRCALEHSHIGRNAVIYGAHGSVNAGDNTWMDLKPAS